MVLSCLTKSPTVIDALLKQGIVVQADAFLQADYFVLPNDLTTNFNNKHITEPIK